MTTMDDTQVHLGASWYPEMWPEEEWHKDVARMKEGGFTLIRLFEFAWKRFEPKEGVYEFDWAVKVLDLLHAEGIQAMIGTPSAAPPAWLTTTYPEVLQTSADGKVKTHGKRKHYNHHSAKYRECCQGIVGQMVEHLGDHPAVHSWQIDNEMSGFDYGQETTDRFHDWLADRYVSVEHLNEIWGLNFWSQAYDDFSQVPLCVATVGSIEVPERNHPSLIVAIARFQNEAWTSFMKEQVDVIRAKCAHPISSNMTGFIGQMNWDNHFEIMDRAGVSSYADLSYFYINTSKMDRLRPMKQAPYWMLETAPNWSGGGPIWNIHHQEEGVRLFSWVSILLGGSMVLYWQWRSHWAGQEMQHGTCVDATGAWMPCKEVWQQLSAEYAAHGDWLMKHPAGRGPIAIMTAVENSWVFSIDPIHPSNQNYGKRITEDYYLPLRDAQYHRDIIHPGANLEDYSLIICPQMAMLSDHTREQLSAWVEEGGRLILGPMSGYRTDEMTARTDRIFGELEELMGARCSRRFTPHWVEDTINVVFENGNRCHPRVWCDGFEPLGETDVLATYQGGYGEGHAAVVSHRHGKGRVVTVGCPLDESCLMGLVDELAAEVDVAPLVKAAPGVMACPRVDASGNLAGLGLVNTTKDPQPVVCPQAGTDLFTGEPAGAELTLPPLGVQIIQYG